MKRLLLALALGGCNGLVGNEPRLESVESARDAGNAGEAGEQPDAGAPVIVDSDAAPKTCGDCLGGKCENGTCLPFVLVVGRSSPESLAIDATHVYYTEPPAGRVSRCHKSGCSGDPEIVAAAQVSPYGIAVTGGMVYWAEHVKPGGRILRCPVGPARMTPCSPEVFATGLRYPLNIAAHGGRVHWTEYDAGASVRWCSVDGCASGSGTLASNQPAPNGIDADDSGIYWGNFIVGGFISRCVDAACTGGVRTMATGVVGPTGIAVRGGSMFYGDLAGNLVACPISGCTGAAQKLAQQPASRSAVPHAVVADDDNVYFTSEPGSFVARCARAGCGGVPTMLATAQGGARGLAVDGEAVYWVAKKAGVVAKVRK